MKTLTRIQLWLLFAISVSIALVTYFSSYALLAPFDYAYLENFYHKSQWQVPQSDRVMSDNELYQVAGKKLLEGADLFSIAPEVPPFGKYLYGLSIVVFGGPYWISLGMFVALAVVFYFICQEIHRNRTVSLLGVLLLITSPIVMDQVGRTMLDLPSVLTLLIHVWCVLRLLKHKTDIGDRNFTAWGELLGAGVSLGFFAACKIPIFVPVVVVADLIFLWRHQIKNLVLIVLLTGLTYVASYTAYFVQGHTVIEWLRAQKWMINFYLTGGSPFVPFSNLITVLTGWYKDWWGQRTWHWTTYWSPVWVLSSVAMVLAVIKPKLTQFRYPAVLGMLLIGVQAFQPFWPRYFLVVLPLGIVCLLPFIESFFKVKHRVAIVLVALLLAGYSLWFLRPTPESFVAYFNEDMNQGDYLEVFNYLVPSDFDRNTFYIELKQIDAALGGTKHQVSLSYQPVALWQNQTTGNLAQSFETPLGEYSFETPVTLIRYHNQWRLEWRWELAVPQYQPGDEVLVQLEPFPVGRLLTSDNQVLSQGTPVSWLIIDLSQVEDLETTVAAASELTGVGGTEIRKQLLVNALPNQILRIAPVLSDLSVENVSTLGQVPGITIVEELTPERSYTQLVDQANQRDLIKHIETYFPELNTDFSGKILLLKSGQEPVTLFEQDLVRPEDVKLGITAQQLLSP